MSAVLSHFSRAGHSSERGPAAVATPPPEPASSVHVTRFPVHRVRPHFPATSGLISPRVAHLLHRGKGRSNFLPLGVDDREARVGVRAGLRAQGHRRANHHRLTDVRELRRPVGGRIERRGWRTAVVAGRRQRALGAATQQRSRYSQREKHANPKSGPHYFWSGNLIGRR